VHSGSNECANQFPASRDAPCGLQQLSLLPSHCSKTCHPGEGRDPSSPTFSPNQPWIPAFAGMTILGNLLTSLPLTAQRNFNVDKPNNTNIIVMIQNLTTT